VAAGADWSRLVGYADRLSVRPGERLRVMVSGEREPKARLVSLPQREPVAAAEIQALAPIRPQPVVTGSQVVIDHDPLLRPHDGLTVSTWVWIAPGAPADGRAELIATADGYALVLDQLRPRFEVGGAAIDGPSELERGVWALLEGILDPDAGTIALRHDETTVTAPEPIGGLGEDPAPLVLGAGFDGKLDRPRIGAGPGGARTVAAWELGSGRGPAVFDGGPHGLHGRCVNGPLRAVTGHNWRGDVHDWRLAPEQYGAMHFHSDAVDDLGWEPSFEIALGESLESGVYALELTAGEVEDMIAFIVRRPATAPAAANVVVLPSFTYLAYSCELAAPAAAGLSQSEDRWVAEHGLRSLYDRHIDGVGVYEASVLRPLTQMRPHYACPQHGGPHGLAQDLILLGWLRRRGIAFDVICDHDLHAEGAAALAGHRTAITGAHPEYATEAMLAALEEHLRGGGSLAYLGGNGLNGSVAVDSARPHVIEIRRTETQGLIWQALPGEHHHAEGGFGGDWRRRGRPEHRMLGVGLRAWGEGPAVGYVRPDGPEDPAAAIAFAGLEPGEPISADGMVQGGAAGYEVDAYDPRAGSPADAVVLASAALGDGYELWPDDVIDDPDSSSPLRADMALVRRPEGGAVFAVGSIAWTGCLGEDDNSISRVTANVLAELSKPEAFGNA
jgi:N,N-dimethylformamidase